jgi:hypothetical protein
LRSTAIQPLNAALALSLLALAPFHPLSQASAAESPLAPAVLTATKRLRVVWSGESASRDLPFPRVGLLAPTTAAANLCPWNDSIAVYCQPQQSIQLNREALNESVVSSEPEWLVGYWISLGLVQVLVAADRIDTPRQEPAATLQANCLAGVLLARTQLQPPATVQALLAPALYAYGPAKISQRGSAAQRAYALLSGFGATDSICDPEAMMALLENRVPDPDRLNQISLLTRRGSSSLLAVLNSRCRPRPGATCPRRLSAVRPTAVQ